MGVRKRLILAVILLSYCVTTMDGAVVITGLEVIARELGLNQSALAWVQNAYMLAWGGFMLLGGKLSDTFGRRSILTLSLVLFGLSSLVAGVAGSDVELIGARFVQGLGAALLAPTALALIVDCFDGPDRVKAIAWYSSISGLGLSVGLVVGGVMAGLLSWRYGFLVNLPVIGVMLVITLSVVPGQKRGSRCRVRFDLKGTALSVGGIFMLVYAVNGASSPWLWLVAALVVLTAFVCVERRSPVAIMPLRLFGGGRPRANFARMLFSGAMTGVYFFLSEYMQEALDLSSLWIGAAFLPLTLSTFWAAIRVPRAVSRWGNMRVLLFGQILMLAGFALLTGLGPHSGYWLHLALPMLILGIGQGFTMSPLTNLGMAGVGADDNGAASGVVNAAHQIGCSAGLSVMVAATAGLDGIVPVCRGAMTVGLIFTIVSVGVLFVRKGYVGRTVARVCLWRRPA